MKIGDRVQHRTIVYLGFPEMISEGISPTGTIVSICRKQVTVEWESNFFEMRPMQYKSDLERIPNENR